ncbi:DUF1279 superfamily [Sporothrix stenoceras]|uniref:DUF1279 superfamily n=1 Tax=Sporothrix stenoceras TaxID=5173 RepID=A0ABR3ZJS6_9PEZI
MLRRSVRALEVLVEQQSAQQSQSAMLLARNSVAQASKQVWRQPAARAISSSSTPVRTAGRPLQSSTFSFTSRTAPRRTFHSSRARRSQEGKGGAGEAGKSGEGTIAPDKLTLSQRIKKLSKEYGWTAVGVYFGLSLLDFPFCFLLVRTLGTDRIAAAEEYVVDHVKTVIPESVKERWRKYRAALKEAKKESGVAGVKGAIVEAATSKDGADGPVNADGAAAGEQAAQEGVQDGWGVKEAERRNKHEASLATQLALAYAIHKSFIFVRVPLAAAVTPKVVKVLRAWGWKIGKPKAA